MIQFQLLNWDLLWLCGSFVLLSNCLIAVNARHINERCIIANYNLICNFVIIVISSNMNNVDIINDILCGIVMQLTYV